MLLCRVTRRAAIEDRALLCPGLAGTDRFLTEAPAKTAGRETPRRLEKTHAARGF